MRTTPIETPLQSGIETAPREALAELQVRRLRATLARREIDAST